MRLKTGRTSILTQSNGLNIDSVFGKAGEQLSVTIQRSECAICLINGEATVSIGNHSPILMGPRPDPFDHLPHVVLLSGEKKLTLTFKDRSLLIIATAPTRRTFPIRHIRPDGVRVYNRGQENWSRTVRLVCWSDNTEGEQLLVGETVTPSGNWSSFPPHRHEIYCEGKEGPEEVPYEEAYFFQFTTPDGFGISRHFDEPQTQDDALILRTNDLLHIQGGYCSPPAKFSVN